MVEACWRGCSVIKNANMELLMSARKESERGGWFLSGFASQSKQAIIMPIFYYYFETQILLIVFIYNFKPMRRQTVRHNCDIL